MTRDSLRALNRQKRRGALLAAHFLGWSILTVTAITNAPFSLVQQDGIDWLVKPGGERIFSLGVCVVSQGATPTNFNPSNPGYAAYRHYPGSNHWAEDTLKRLKGWGFTTVGGWSDYAALARQAEADVAWTPVLHVGSTCGVPWWDMWDSNIIARMHQVARDKILPLRDDPRLLGYYSDNEMGWWNAILFKMTLEQAPTSGQRQRLIRLLREIYADDWQLLLKDFDPEGVDSFEQLNQKGMLFLRPGSRGIRTYRRFLSLLAERYYALVREVIRTYDSRGLVMGDRYQSFYYPEVASAGRGQLDVASANLNAAWNDGTFPRFYLDTLHALCGRPVIVSEFYMAASENRSGNKNDQGTFPTVQTQKQRVAGARTTLAALLKIPYVVGADWFQYFDEPTHGRADGENYNFGLVDIRNEPYAPLTAAFAALNPESLKKMKHALRDATDGIPPAPPNPLANFSVTQALKHWDREQGFVQPLSKFPLADLYVCWDSKALYLGLYAQDIAEEAYYRNKLIPEIDRAEWTVGIAGAPKPIRVRLGPGGPALSDEPSTRALNLSGIYLATRNIAALEIPAKHFGKRRLRRGDQVELTSTFYSHCRADQVEWKGKFRLQNKP